MPLNIVYFLHVLSILCLLMFKKIDAQRNWDEPRPRTPNEPGYNIQYANSDKVIRPGDSHYSGQGAPYPNNDRGSYNDQNTRGQSRNGPYNAPGLGNPPVLWGPNNIDNGQVDSRCFSQAFNEKQDLYTSVDITSTSVVTGRVVNLCDGPEVPEHGRPKPGRPTSIAHSVSVFLGIPYAEPPTLENNLRFKAPKVKSALRVIQATKYMPACPQNVRYFGQQMGIDGVHEDCLYLNIFRPNAKQGYMKKFPVMIYIHGGNWDHGSANSFPAHMLSASQEVVVVTFNYRLGALGFLATGDAASPGNYGILDQSMAIQWVYERIEKFNGDPNNITLFGPGAGGASAGLHMISHKTADVVRRVIAQSGSALADWAFIADPTYMYNSSRIFGRALGCTSLSSYDLVECLRSRSSNDLMNIERKPEVGWLLWGPVLDNATESRERCFFPKPLEKLLDEIPFFPAGFSYMAGVTRDEAVSMLIDDEDLRKNRYVVTKKLFDKKIMEYMHMYNYTLNPEAIFNAISFMYTHFASPDNDTLLRQGYIDMLSDSYYKAPNDKLLKKLIEKGVATYMYVLNYTIEGLVQPDWHGVPHNTEYLLSTGAPFMDPNFFPPIYKVDKIKWTEADRNMSIFFMKTWANFAKTGNPTPEAVYSIKWFPMEKNNLQYLSVNTTNMTSIMLRDYRQKECQFWSDYLPTLIDKVMPTWPPYMESWEEREKRIYTGALYGMVGAVAFFIFLTFLCCCLYCRAKSKHLVEDEGLPSSITASDSFLGLNIMEGNRKFSPEVVIMNEGAHKHTRV